MYERGDIHWPRTYRYYSKYHRQEFDMVDVLKKEFWMFPRAEHDDLIDCHSFCLKVKMYQADTAKVEEKSDEFNWWRQQAIDVKKKMHNPFNGPNHIMPFIPHRKSWR